MFNKLRTLRRNSKGATAIEYSLIAALISIAAITAFQNVGTAVSNTMNNVQSHLPS